MSEERKEEQKKVFKPIDWETLCATLLERNKLTLEDKTDEKEFRLKIKHNGNPLIDGVRSKYGGMADNQPIPYIIYDNPTNQEANYLNIMAMSKAIIDIEIQRKLRTLRTEDAYLEYQRKFIENLQIIYSQTNPR